MKEFAMNELFPLIEEGIKNGGKYRFYPKGTSMLPLIRQGIDSVVLTDVGEIKKYDMILYIRDDGAFVLHRVVGIRNGLYDLCGDNQCFIERGVRPDQVRATVDGIYRGDEFVSPNSPKYMKYVKKRVASIPARNLISRIRSAVSKLKS